MLRSSPFRSVPRTSIDQLNSRLVLVSKVRSTKIWDYNSLVYLFMRELWSYCSNCRANQSTRRMNEMEPFQFGKRVIWRWKETKSQSRVESCTVRMQQMKCLCKIFKYLTNHVHILLNIQRTRYAMSVAYLYRENRDSLVQSTFLLWSSHLWSINYLSLSWFLIYT